MYTDISKIRQTSKSIPKSEYLHLLKDGRVIFYDCDFLKIYNMSTYKEEIIIDNKTFPWKEKFFPYYWGELVSLIELNNGNLVLGFGKGYDFTNLIIDINKPKIVHKFQIDNEDYCCRNLASFYFDKKEYFIAGDYNPQIYSAEAPFKEIIKR